jgi:hypothetical protein
MIVRAVIAIADADELKIVAELLARLNLFA